MSKDMAVEIELEAGGRLGVEGDAQGLTLCLETSDTEIDVLIERDATRACLRTPKLTEAEAAWLCDKIVTWVRG